MAFRCPRGWLWRWRRNPLKRRADVVEAWVLLGTGTLTVVVGVLAGLTVTRSVEREMARERAEWRPVAASLTEDTPGPPPASSVEQVWAEVRWVAPDGSTRTGQARVRPGSPEGSPVTVWTDGEGGLVAEPASEEQARLRSSLVGGFVGGGAAAVPLVGGRLLLGRLECRRLDQWDVDWARFDPLWGPRAG
ncbi:Rv1733c family protein [Streptomyces cadmiisoli]|uniref:Uncharacterized protein n=1 Tax=Streptomyces cadmiisoli TaxID=2184053 RepID=A0A2Z4J987_9ACTN|nr:hypothetical protein [Streptomyces cadmiisoli]AWW40973.1 hypothetical protein DN051_33430 [Streptomyces cadmiisoli]